LIHEKIEEEVEMKVKLLMKEIEDESPWRNLPENSPVDYLHNWLVRIRTNQILNQCNNNNTNSKKCIQNRN